MMRSKISGVWKKSRAKYQKETKKEGKLGKKKFLENIRKKRAEIAV